MPQRHLLTCPDCGKPNPIDTTQAGQTVSCQACGKPLSVPTLRKIRELPVDAEQEVSVSEGWSFERRSKFAIGMAALILGSLSCGGFLYARSQLETEIPPIPEEEIFIQIVDESPIDELWLKWKESVRSTELGEWTPSEISQSRKMARYLDGVAIAAGVIAFGGLAYAGLSFRTK